MSGDWNDIAAYFTSYIADPTIGRRTIAFDEARSPPWPSPGRAVNSRPGVARATR